MGNIPFSKAILFLSFFIFCPFFQQTNCYPSVTQNRRETLEIIIGGGSSPPAPPPSECEDCPPQPECPPPLPPPPEPECPPPPSPPPPSPSPRRPRPSLPPVTPPLSAELARDIRTIQNFKKTIICNPLGDPLGVTKTWNGNKICIDKNVYKGFLCARIPVDNTLRVAGVKFNGFHFKGCQPLSISNFVEKLKDVVFFHANSNNFTDDIPLGIGKLTYFYEIDLSNNKFKGGFPMSVLTATNLTFLDLRFNSFTGTVPDQVFKLDLDVLFLNNNMFSGYLPSNLGSTTALYLTLANNKFIGPIPKSIGQASKTLLEVLFLNNLLSGCLPYEIGLLKKLTLFDASQNQLTGPIPLSFGCLESLQQLNLASNKLYGAVPETLCKLKNLFKITLKNNYFTEVGPECRELIERRILDVSMNCILDLPGQKTKEECENFFEKKRVCPDKASMSYVPCHIDDSASLQVLDDEKPPPVPAPSPSYAALEIESSSNRAL